MREVTQHEPGTLWWTELATTDTDAAGHFYASLFEWAIKKQETGPQAYTELWKGPRPPGGMMAIQSASRRGAPARTGTSVPEAHHVPAILSLR